MKCEKRTRMAEAAAAAAKENKKLFARKRIEKGEKANQIELHADSRDALERMEPKKERKKNHCQCQWHQLYQQKHLEAAVFLTKKMNSTMSSSQWCNIMPQAYDVIWNQIMFSLFLRKLHFIEFIFCHFLQSSDMAE